MRIRTHTEPTFRTVSPLMLNIGQFRKMCHLRFNKNANSSKIYVLHIHEKQTLLPKNYLQR